MLSLVLWTTVSALASAPVIQESQLPADPVTTPLIAPLPADPVMPVVPPEPGQDTRRVEPTITDSADIVVTARENSAKIDPLRALNERSFEATEAVDKALVAPIANSDQRRVGGRIDDQRAGGGGRCITDRKQHDRRQRCTTKQVHEGSP